MNGDLFDRHPVLCMAVIAAGIIAIVGLAVWAAPKHAEPTTTLRNREWVCSASHNVTWLQPFPAGKTTVLVPLTRTVCDQYTRSAG